MNEKKSSPEKSASNEITAASRTTFHYYSATTGKNIRKYKSSIRKNKKPNPKTVSSITTCATIRRDDNEQEHNEQNGVLPQDKQ